MGIQDDAARTLSEALARHHLNAQVAYGMTPSVKVSEYPGAVVYFSLDQLGGLQAKLVIDTRAPEYLNVAPSAAGADALAAHILKQVAGEGGRRPE